MIKERIFMPANLYSQQQEKITAIHAAVREARMRMDMSSSALSSQALPEGSCFGLGEFDNLFWAQLVRTREGNGEWGSINTDPSNKAIVDGLYDWLTKTGLI